jgi:hypothetical protein
LRPYTYRHNPFLDRDPLNLVKRQLVTPAVIKLRRARAGIVRHRDRLLGPRTDAGGLTGTTWLVTSQSKRRRIAARRCLTVGAATSCVCPSIQVVTCGGCTASIDGTPARAHQSRTSLTARL